MSWMTKDELRRQKKYGRTLKQVARYIAKHLPELRAVTEAWTTNTDRHYGRIRWPGKGRSGTRLRVFKDQFLLFDHKPDFHRRVAEVTDWLERWEGGERVDQTGHDSRHWSRT